MLSFWHGFVKTKREIFKNALLDRALITIEWVMIKVTSHVPFSFIWLLMNSYIKLWWFACLKVFDGNTETDKTFKFKTGKGKVIKVLLNVILIYTFHGCAYFQCLQNI